MQDLRSLTFLVILASTGCTTADMDAPPTATGGGKGDNARECGTQQLIDAARQWAIIAGPDELRGEQWTQGSVDPIEDLDEDGVDDLVILPGSWFAGGNVATVVAFTGGYDEASGCSVRFAGYFAAASVGVSMSRTRSHGVLDLVEVNVSACEATTVRWRFDGTIYSPTDDISSMSVCD